MAYYPPPGMGMPGYPPPMMPGMGMGMPPPMMPGMGMPMGYAPTYCTPPMGMVVPPGYYWSKKGRMKPIKPFKVHKNPYKVH
ncbi:hypothetical protein Pelo_11639 [Pelomyxa schiedti]|nr:hypothetical protein Pelo_11639 [Pelomyxa schiedti]